MLELQPAERICRICLNTHSDHQPKFVSPCACSGSAKYVHEYCLKTWLNYQLNTPQMKNKKDSQLDCEICASPIGFTTRQHYHCNDLKRVKKLVKQDKTKLVMSVVLEVFLLGTLGFLIA